MHFAKGPSSQAEIGTADWYRMQLAKGPSQAEQQLPVRQPKQPPITPAQQAASADPLTGSDLHKRLQRNPSNKLSAVDQKYDADHDGRLNELERTCKKYDVDGDGVFSILEVERIVEDMQSAKKEATNMFRVAIAAIFSSLIMCGVLMGLMFAANEVSKESHATKSPPSLVNLNGEVMQTADHVAFASIYHLHEYSSEVLQKLRFLSFFARKDPADLSSQEETALRSALKSGTPAPVTEFYIQVDSWSREKDGKGDIIGFMVTTPNGGELSCDQGCKTMTYKAKTFKGFSRSFELLQNPTVEKASRRLLEMQGRMHLFPTAAALRSETTKHHSMIAKGEENERRRAQSVKRSRRTQAVNAVCPASGCGFAEIGSPTSNAVDYAVQCTVSNFYACTKLECIEALAPGLIWNEASKSCVRCSASSYSQCPMEKCNDNVAEGLVWAAFGCTKCTAGYFMYCPRDKCTKAVLGIEDLFWDEDKDTCGRCASNHYYTCPSSVCNCKGSAASSSSGSSCPALAPDLFWSSDWDVCMKCSLDDYFACPEALCTENTAVGLTWLPTPLDRCGICTAQNYRDCPKEKCSDSLLPDLVWLDAGNSGNGACVLCNQRWYMYCPQAKCNKASVGLDGLKWDSNTKSCKRPAPTPAPAPATPTPAPATPTPAPATPTPAPAAPTPSPGPGEEAQEDAIANLVAEKVLQRLTELGLGGGGDSGSSDGAV